jgi:F-type H+-transporting ATPase subunit gamma
MASLKELKTRRKSVISTKKVTSAMKMIAASKLKKSQDNMLKARPYSSKIKEVIQMLVFGSDSFSSEFFAKRPGDRTLYILVTSDKGLCGGFNSNIIKGFTSLFRNNGEDKIIAVGTRIANYVTKMNIPIVRTYYGAFNKLSFQLAAEIGAEIINLYKNNEIDRAVIIYNRFQSALAQIVVQETILPIELEQTNSAQNAFKRTRFETEPETGELFDSIFPKYINFLVWRGVLESYASENAARMTTMESATDNASEMIDKLSLDINKARQAAITQEISEIVGGSAGLNS